MTSETLSGDKHMGAERGRAIFLVGPSSAGKSSLGNALVEVLPEPFMFFETDRCGLRGPSGRPELVTAAREEVVTRGAAYAIRGYLDAGLDVVVEVGLWHRRARAMAAAVFAPYKAWLVGLRWTLSELERRERQRGDRRLPGTARSQATPAGAWVLPCDLVVDVVEHPPAVAAGEVVVSLAKAPVPRGIRTIAGWTSVTFLPAAPHCAVRPASLDTEAAEMESGSGEAHRQTSRDQPSGSDARQRGPTPRAAVRPPDPGPSRWGSGSDREMP